MRILLPESWSDVTVGQFIKLYQAKKSFDDKLELMVEIISILADIEREKLYDVSVTEIGRIFKKLDFIERLEFPEKVEPLIKLKEDHFQCDFNIFDNLKAGRYIDHMTFTKGNEDDRINNLHNILAVHYVPVGKKYNEVPHQEVARLIYNECPISVAYPATVFFWTLWLNSIQSLRDFSEKNLSNKLRTILATT